MHPGLGHLYVLPFIFSGDIITRWVNCPFASSAQGFVP